MKTLFRILPAVVALIAAPSASAATYTGTWKNTTFGSTGPLIIKLTVGKSSVSGSFDFDGNVFGMVDPPAIPFDTPLKSDGSGVFKVKGTDLGDITVNFESNGEVKMTIINIPGGFLSKMVFNGKFDLKLKTFKGTYQIDDASGPYAEGVASAHVPTPPVIKAKREVAVTGAKGEVKVTVVSNTRIKSFTASSPDGATVSVSGKNPYQVVVTQIKNATTRVVIVAKNADGKSSSKTVKFIRSGSGSPVLDSL